MFKTQMSISKYLDIAQTGPRQNQAISNLTKRTNV